MFLAEGEKGVMVSLRVRAVGSWMLDVLDAHWEAQILIRRRKGEGRCLGRFEHAEAWAGMDSWCYSSSATGHCACWGLGRYAKRKVTMQSLGILGDDQVAPPGI